MKLTSTSSTIWRSIVIGLLAAIALPIYFPAELAIARGGGQPSLPMAGAKWFMSLAEAEKLMQVRTETFGIRDRNDNIAEYMGEYLPELDANKILSAEVGKDGSKKMVTLTFNAKDQLVAIVVRHGTEEKTVAALLNQYGAPVAVGHADDSIAEGPIWLTPDTIVRMEGRSVRYLARAALAESAIW